MPSSSPSADGAPAPLLPRFAALVLDGLGALLLASPGIGWAYAQLLARYPDLTQQGTSAEASRQISNPGSPGLFWLGVISLCFAAGAVLWETIFLVWRGATPGKMLLGLHVREATETGERRPGLLAAATRALLKVLPVILSVVPALGLLGQLWFFLDCLWPAGQHHFRALHDLVAKTRVVRGGVPLQEVPDSST